MRGTKAEDNEMEVGSPQAAWPFLWGDQSFSSPSASLRNGFNIDINRAVKSETEGIRMSRHKVLC